MILLTTIQFQRFKIGNYKMKYYIIAGEPSGDLHGSKLIKEIFKVDKNAEIRFWGGDLMKDAGGKMVMHYKNLAFSSKQNHCIKVGSKLYYCCK